MNKLGLLRAVAVAGWFAMAPANADLIAHYVFTDGDLLDNEVVGGHSLINAGPAPVTLGSGTAVFTSEANVNTTGDNYLRSNNVSELNLQTFTVSFWMKTAVVDQGGTYHGIFSSRATGADASSWQFFSDGDGTNAAGTPGGSIGETLVRGGASPNQTDSAMNPVHAANTWYHVAFTSTDVANQLVMTISSQGGSLGDLANGVVYARDVQLDHFVFGTNRALNSTYGMELANIRIYNSVENLASLWSEGPVGPPVQLPVIDSFTVTDRYVMPGSTVTLAWSAANYDTLVLDPGGIDAAALTTGGSGGTALTVNETTTFTLTATRGGNVASRSTAVTAGPPRPNIVLFLVDDMGVHDTSVPFLLDGTGQPKTYNFNSFYRTPNMETLASTGMRFTTAYAQSVCSPTRCGLLTGRTSARHGVTDWVGANDPGSPPNWRINGITASEVTLPKLFQANGYRTIHVGKAHYAISSVDVRDFGFDVNIAGNHLGQPARYIGAGGYGVPGLSAYDSSTTYLTKALTLEANTAIQNAVNAGQPFFLNMSFYAVHAPFTFNPDATGNYSGAFGGSGGNHAKFATMIEGMDIAVGQIRQKLIDLGVAKDTLIIFLGDNGSDSPATTQDGLPSAPFSDWPMRGKKASKWEGGVRVPFIATWALPDATNAFQQALPIPAGSLETDIVTTWDIPATLLDLVGLPTPAGFGEDSHSLLPYLTGTPGAHRPQEIVVHYPHEHRSDFFSWIRQGDLKLIYNFQNNSHQLYNLATDPTESNNLAASQPDEVMRLARRLAQNLDSEWGQAGILLPAIASTAPPGNVVSIPNSAGIDLDNDGIDDRDEDPNLNGLVDAGETNPDNDNTDGDRTPDGAERKTGTDPLNPSSDFKGTLVPDTGTAYSILWPSKPGALYRIESSTTLDAAEWDAVADDVPAHASDPTTTYPLPAATDPSRFYRVMLK